MDRSKLIERWRCEDAARVAAEKQEGPARAAERQAGRDAACAWIEGASLAKVRHFSDRSGRQQDPRFWRFLREDIARELGLGVINEGFVDGFVAKVAEIYDELKSQL